MNSKEIVLAGISQGGMLALHNGLRRKKRVGGILCISGMMIWRNGMEDEILHDGSPQILFIHGDADEVVPISKARKAEGLLRGLNADVTLLNYPDMGHAPNSEAIYLGGEYLRTVLSL